MEPEDFLFIPLGGVGHIGMNVSLYHYQGKWIMIDLGAGFADDHMPGIDMIVADISFIAERRDDLLGIVLTHAHEDHLGAVQYLWEELRCPVFTTPFTACFLKAKLSEYGLSDTVPIHEVDTSKKLELGPFGIEFIHMTHSVPETNAIAIHTDKGVVLHTGDWKFDDGPVIGEPSDIAALKRLGNAGVMAMVGDSTNVFTEGKSGSESGVYDDLYKTIEQSDQLVAISLFASNVARIYTIAKIAQALGREVVMLGRSLWRVVRAAQETGYLGDLPEFLEARQASHLPRNKMLLLCTGCQGEPLAVSAKLARNAHPLMHMNRGDVMVFSSKIIPGNQERIYSMFNHFVNIGVKLVTENIRHVHVSGHPAREELRQMYALVKPQLSIPVHGEYIHMHEHAKLAKECGVNKTLIVKPGDVVDLEKGETIDSVNYGYFGIDGSFLHHPEGDVMKMRRRMQDAGLIVVTLILGRNNALLKQPTVFAPGVFCVQEETELVKAIVKEVTKTLRSNSKNQKIHKSIENVVYHMIKRDIQKKPFIEVQIERV